jgi:hypothetical protein
VLETPWFGPSCNVERGFELGGWDGLPFIETEEREELFAALDLIIADTQGHDGEGPRGSQAEPDRRG